MKLILDLAHPHPRPSRLGWLLLGLGMVAALWVGWRYVGGTHRLEEARAQVAALAPAAVKSAGPASRPGQESAMAVNARRALRADWAGLLASLERSRPARIALLNVEVDAAQGRLGLKANAKDLPAMLAYLQDLETMGLHQVRLQSHAVMEEEGQEYVHFSASAGWGAETRP